MTVIPADSATADTPASTTTGFLSYVIVASVFAIALLFMPENRHMMADLPRHWLAMFVWLMTLGLWLATKMQNTVESYAKAFIFLLGFLLLALLVSAVSQTSHCGLWAQCSRNIELTVNESAVKRGIICAFADLMTGINLIIAAWGVKNNSTRWICLMCTVVICVCFSLEIISNGSIANLLW
jgi:hypothetical protein